jgi:hypothetical protein
MASMTAMALSHWRWHTARAAAAPISERTSGFGSSFEHRSGRVGREADSAKFSRVVTHYWRFGVRQPATGADLTIIKDSNNDEPRIACVKHLAVGVCQPTIAGNWHVLHCDGMIDVATSNADLRLVPSDNNIAMPDKPPTRQLLVRQLVSFAGITDPGIGAYSSTGSATTTHPHASPHLLGT